MLQAKLPVIRRRRSRRNIPLNEGLEDPLNRDLVDRFQRERFVNYMLNTLDVPLFDVCVDNGPFVDAVQDLKLIGKGGFGKVYSARLPNTPEFIIKEAILKKSEEKKLKHSLGSNVMVKQSYPDEYKIMTLINNAIYSESIPNFILTYNIAVCQSCRDGKEQCYTAFTEKAIGDLKMIWDKLNDRIAKSLLFQLLAALFWIHSTYGIYHADIKRLNILVLHGKDYGTTTYNINNIEYEVENVGYTFCLNDFGISQIHKPAFTNQNFLGTRNARVNANEILEPITCDAGLEHKGSKNLPTIKPVKSIKWEGGVTGSECRFSTTHDQLTSIPVDLNDTISFPSFEFFLDIQDVLKMCIGGKTLSHKVPHPGIAGLSREFVAKIKPYCHDSFPYTFDSAKLLRADLMLKELYGQFPPPLKFTTSYWMV